MLASPPSAPEANPELAEVAWRVIGAVGVTFMVMGALDIALAWSPLDFGKVEWEFGVISSTMNSLPVPSMGIGLFTAAAMMRRDRGALTATMLWCGAALVAFAGALVFLLLDLAPVYGAVEAGTPARQALNISNAKTAAAFVVYPWLHVVLLLRARRALRAST